MAGIEFKNNLILTGVFTESDLNIYKTKHDDIKFIKTNNKCYLFNSDYGIIHEFSYMIPIIDINEYNDIINNPYYWFKNGYLYELYCISPNNYMGLKTLIYEDNRYKLIKDDKYIEIPNYMTGNPPTKSSSSPYWYKIKNTIVWANTNNPTGNVLIYNYKTGIKNNSMKGKILLMDMNPLINTFPVVYDNNIIVIENDSEYIFYDVLNDYIVKNIPKKDSETGNKIELKPNKLNVIDIALYGANGSIVKHKLYTVQETKEKIPVREDQCENCRKSICYNKIASCGHLKFCKECFDKMLSTKKCFICDEEINVITFKR